MVIAAGALVLTALAATFAASTRGDGIEASLITDPALDPEPATTTSTYPTDFGDPLPAFAVPSSIDALVPGFTDTLVMTAGTGAGLEIWTWTSGPDGTLTRDPVPGDLFDARFDVSGDQVAALSQFADDPPWLVVTGGEDVVPIFYGARSFAWHVSVPGLIAWMSQIPGEDAPTLYLGARNDGGMYFKPIATLPGFDAMDANQIHDRLAGYDGTGFVIERWTMSDAAFAPTVVRLDLEGRPVATMPGTFAGLSASGEIAVSGADSIKIVAGPDMAATMTIPGLATSAVWSPDGTLVASTPDGQREVAIDDGDHAATTYQVEVDRPTVHAWSSDGRFVIVSGHAGDDPVLLFIDTANDSIRQVPVDVHPISVAVVP